MTDQQESMCEIEIGTLSEQEIHSLWSDFWMYKISGAVFVLLIVTISSFSLLQFVSLMLGIKFLASGNCLTIAIMLGTLTILGGLPSVIGEAKALKTECTSAVCEVLNLRIADAVEFETMMAQTGVALDCGEYIVLLLGGWWIDNADPPVFVWLGDRNSVPSTSCSIRLLPRSGRVLSVSNDGAPLRIRRPQGKLLRTKLELPCRADLIYAKLSIDRALVNADSINSH
jgi:hypothetical protein